MRAAFPKLLSLLVCGLALGVILTEAAPARAGTYPEPSKYPLSWELKFKHGTPKRIAVNLPDKGTVAFWYLTFTVTNQTDKEQQFLPTFDLVTNDGRVIHSDFAIPEQVFLAIKSAEGNDLLERLPKMAGTIRIGDDQARDGVAIWPEPTPRMGAFSIFVGGLSGEFVMLKDGDGKPKLDADGNPIILRKTLEIDYVIYGDELYPDKDEIHFKEERWVMR